MRGRHGRPMSDHHDPILRPSLRRAHRRGDPSVLRPGRPRAAAQAAWTVAAALLFAGATPAHADDGAGRPEAAAAAPRLASDDLDLENADALRGLKAVALAGVAVYVVTEASGGASAGAAFRDRTMVSTGTAIKVVGLEPARLQALADEAHDRIADALRARGLAVVPLDELKALPAYAELAAAADPAPLALDASAGKGQIFSGRGLPLIHQGEQAWLNRMVGGLFGAKVEDRFVGMGQNLSSAMRKPRLDAALDALSRATGAAVVMARVVLTAAEVKAAGGAFALGASTQTRNTLLMPAWTNRLWVRRADGAVGRVSLKQALVSEAGLGELVDVTSTGTQAANIAVTAFTMLAAMSGTGRGVVASSRDLELRSSPERFEAVARPQLRGLADGLAQALAP